MRQLVWAFDWNRFCCNSALFNNYVDNEKRILLATRLLYKEVALNYLLTIGVDLVWAAKGWSVRSNSSKANGFVKFQRCHLLHGATRVSPVVDGRGETPLSNQSSPHWFSLTNSYKVVHDVLVPWSARSRHRISSTFPHAIPCFYPNNNNSCAQHILQHTYSYTPLVESLSSNCLQFDWSSGFLVWTVDPCFSTYSVCWGDYIRLCWDHCSTGIVLCRQFGPHFLVQPLWPTFELQENAAKLGAVGTFTSNRISSVQMLFCLLS